jgi:hypothetical protein
LLNCPNSPYLLACEAGGTPHQLLRLLSTTGVPEDGLKHKLPLALGSPVLLFGLLKLLSKLSGSIAINERPIIVISQLRDNFAICLSFFFYKNNSSHFVTVTSFFCSRHHFPSLIPQIGSSLWQTMAWSELTLKDKYIRGVWAIRMYVVHITPHIHTLCSRINGDKPTRLVYLLKYKRDRYSISLRWWFVVVRWYDGNIFSII